ncbi:MAG TPA: hypothetical protein VNE71_12290, partial [Myxococcota bacterium]|nr:hypothetical protein [Myxococcota bacterium]
MSNASLPPAALPELPTPAEQAAEALRGWLDAGERIAVLLAPRGGARHDALARLERSVEDRFVAERWSAATGSSARPSTLEELRGRRALAIVESGEELGAEGARTLRASLEDPAGARCAVVALAADEAGAVLPALGAGIEVVVLRDARRAAAPSPARTLRAGGAAALAVASIALAALVVLPRLADEPDARPAEAAPEAPPAPLASLPVEQAPVRTAPVELPPVAAAPP